MHTKSKSPSKTYADWDDFSSEQIADKMLQDKGVSSHRHKATIEQQKCLICVLEGEDAKTSRIRPGQYYWKHSARLDKVAHDKCVIDFASGSEEEPIDMSLSKKPMIVGGSENPRSTASIYDKESFNAGYAACVRKLIIATADDPALQKTVLAKMIIGNVEAEREPERLTVA